jgi:hypothetical protein
MKKNAPLTALAISLLTWMEDLHQMTRPLDSHQDHAALFSGQLQAHDTAYCFGMSTTTFARQLLLHLHNT